MAAVGRMARPCATLPDGRYDADRQTWRVIVFDRRRCGRLTGRLPENAMYRVRPKALHTPLSTSIYHPLRWYMDGLTMPTNVSELRHRPAADSEKITINLGYVDLGHVDLMVKDVFYSNRTDFIRTAIRNQLDRHAEVVRQSVSRKALELGLRHYSRADLEAALSRGELLHINVLGLASIAHDVTAELARASIASVTVLGALQASSEVKAALADRTH